MWCTLATAAAAILVSYVALKYSRSNVTYSPLTTTLNTSYDYVIVGAGSAGCVIANRLSEDNDVTVLLIETGGDDRGDARISIPGLAPLLHHSDRDWDYVSTPQKHGMEGFVDKKLHMPGGRLLGGSSSTNYMTYVRGHPHDYDQWAKQGCEGWSYKDVLSYFMKSENAQDIDNLKKGCHGTDGPMKVERASDGRGLAEILLKGARELGLSLVDSNAEKDEGVTFAQQTAYKGERYSTSKAFLHPVLHRNNLHVVVDTYVTKVLFEGKRAVGVEMIRRSKKQVVRARREVIVSAGAIGSPKLLLLSGVGPKEHLKELGIPMKADLPVGDNLQDHLLFEYMVEFQQPVGFTLADFESPWTWAQFKLFGSGLLSHAGHVLHLFVSTSNDSRREQWPDIQVMLMEFAYGTPVMEAYRATKQAMQELKRRDKIKHGFTCLPILLRPRSRGTVRLQSFDPFADPLIDPNYFSHPEDAPTLQRGIRICERLLSTPALQSIGATLADDPSPSSCGKESFGTDHYWECLARGRSKTVYHYSGTCKMGAASDKTAVLDPQLRVRGLNNLRVVDASVFPTIPSGNTNAAVIMVAEKAADIIRKRNS